LYWLAAGIWIGLSLLKFGNPVILDRMVTDPHDFLELLINPWPLKWGYMITAFIALAGIRLARFTFPRKVWPVGLLAFWFGWVLLSNAKSIDPRLSNPTILHFTFCMIVFAIGFFILRRVNAPAAFWIPVILGFSYMLFTGFDQHNGGLEATRKAFYAQPDWQTYPKEFLLKIETNRIFATLVYPNALAGAIILFLPALLWKLWTLTERWPRILRMTVGGLFGYLAIADLYWTGSKGGWLIALVLLGVLLLHLHLPKKIKVALVISALVVGASAFAIKFAAYFKKGAPSIGARFNYWEAAAQNAIQHPLLGTGPGTFQTVFAKVKKPEEEMAKLVHCDYLQQATDSGIPAFLAFFAFFVACLITLYRYSQKSMLHFLLWLGLFGYAIQSFIEFGLYIPALVWPCFLLLGVFWGEMANLEPENQLPKSAKS
jgi:hypothetical protein